MVPSTVNHFHHVVSYDGKLSLNRVLKHEKPNLYNCKDRHDTGNEASTKPLQVAFSTGKLQLLLSKFTVVLIAKTKFLISFKSNSKKPERALKPTCARNIRRLTQGIDAVSKCQQRSVDVSAFYHSFATILQRKESFTFTSNNLTKATLAKLLQLTAF